MTSRFQVDLEIVNNNKNEDQHPIIDRAFAFECRKHSGCDCFPE